MEWTYVWDWPAWSCSIYLGGYVRWIWQSSGGYRRLCIYPKR